MRFAGVEERKKSDTNDISSATSVRMFSAAITNCLGPFDKNRGEEAILTESACGSVMGIENL